MKIRLVVVAAATLAACSPIRTPPFPVPPPFVTGRTLSRAEALADLEFLMTTFEEVHPNLYAMRPHDSVAAARRRIEADLPSTLSRFDWWRRLAPLVASFGDGHTNLHYPSDEVLKIVNAGELVFPPSVVLDADGHATLGTVFMPAPGLNRADRLVAVNGLHTDSLMASFVAEQSGESRVFRGTSVLDQFRDLLVVHDVHAPFALTVAGRDGAARTVTIPGIRRDSLMALSRASRPANAAATPANQMNTRNFSYQTLDRRVGYMNFRTMGGDFTQYAADLTAMFKRIEHDSASALIVDLRSNGGGNSRLGDELLRHINTKPYRMASRKDWKMSKQYRAYIKTSVRAPLRWIPIQNLFSEGRKMFKGPAGKIASFEFGMKTPSRAEPFFSGPVCVLVGTRTFSSAVSLADAVKTYQLATIIGEETGGHPTAFGEVYPFILPNSGFFVSSSSATFVRANGDAGDLHGIIPDVVIAPTPDDRRAGRDPVMQRARQCGK